VKSQTVDKFLIYSHNFVGQSESKVVTGSYCGQYYILAILLANIVRKLVESSTVK